jgi:hypothetical protein
LLALGELANADPLAPTKVQTLPITSSEETTAAVEQSRKMSPQDNAPELRPRLGEQPRNPSGQLTVSPQALPSPAHNADVKAIPTITIRVPEAGRDPDSHPVHTTRVPPQSMPEGEFGTNGNR